MIAPGIIVAILVTVIGIAMIVAFNKE